ncbi:AI-2E family transporter [Candidatus Parcubacteria bacterium]|nr:MAG: AI-2E family transporter [Candidatus Parcubacteria bacterium]
MEQRPVTIAITPGTVAKAILVFVAAWLIFELRDLVLVLLTAIVLASAIEPAIVRLGMWRIPRVLAALSVYAFLFGAFFGIFYFFIPTLFGDITSLIVSLPAYIQTFNEWMAFDEYAYLFGGESAPVISTTDLLSGLQQFSGTTGVFGSNILSAIANIFGGVFSFILIVVFSFYFTVIRTGVDDFLEIVTPQAHRAYVLDLWERSRQKIGLWMQGQLLLGVIIGVLVYLGLTILGVEHALLLAIIAALFEIIPVFGPILAAVPAIAIALTSGGLTLGILTTALYVIVQQFENHLIYPLVVTRVVGVPPLLVILALIVGAQMAGFLGILLSIPIAAVIQELAKDIRDRRFLATSPAE